MNECILVNMSFYTVKRRTSCRTHSTQENLTDHAG